MSSWGVPYRLVGSHELVLELADLLMCQVLSILEVLLVLCVSRFELQLLLLHRRQQPLPLALELFLHLARFVLERLGGVLEPLVAAIVLRNGG